jgi:hypothetical protein
MVKNEWHFYPLPNSIVPDQGKEYFEPDKLPDKLIDQLGNPPSNRSDPKRIIEKFFIDCSSEEPPTPFDSDPLQPE